MSSTSAAAVPGGKTWFGHPRGLSTLFFTEMWERFSYYGMRALLILFLVASVQNGGFGLTDKKAAAIYGLYTAGVYLMALPGGWIADRIFGQRRAVFIGGCVIAAGHFSMAVPTVPSFYLGLCLIVIGTGLLKPNVSAMVGDLYPEGGARRDSGFSFFYMGINSGAFIGPFICGFLGERVNWHFGFGAAGVGMVLGLIQYRLGARTSRNGRAAAAPGAGSRRPEDRHPGRPDRSRDSRGGARRRRHGERQSRNGGQGHGGRDRLDRPALLRLRPPFRRLDGRREEARRRDLPVLPGVVPLLGGLRAGRLFVQPLCVAADRSHGRRLGAARRRGSRPCPRRS